MLAGMAGLGAIWFLPSWLKRLSPAWRIAFIGSALTLLGGWFIVITAGDLQAILVLTLLIFVLLITLFQPIAGLLAYLALLYIRPQEIYPSLMTLKPVTMTGFLGLGIWALRTAVERGRRRFLRTPNDLMLPLFWLTAIISTLINEPKLWEHALRSFMDKPVIHFLILGTVMTMRRLKLIILIVVVYTATLVISGIWQHFTGVGLGGQTPIDGRIRALGIFSDPNDLAQAFVICVPFLIWFAIEGRYPLALRILGVLTGCALIYGIYLTGSRGGMLSLAVAVGLYTRRKLGTVMALALAALIVIGMISMGPSRLGEISTRDESARGRLEAWWAGIGMFKSHPILGVGYSRFTEYHYLVAHNSFVHVLAEMGFLGAFLWVAMIYCAIKALLEVIGTAGESEEGEIGYAILTALAGFLVSSFFLSRSYNILLYLLIAFALTLRGMISDREGLSELRFTPFDAISVIGIECSLIAGIYLLLKFTT
jgi:O-antigen ligase